jgi:hypothetical protein
MSVSYINVDQAIKEAKKITEDKAEVLRKLNIVRTDLRNAVDMGGCTPEQIKFITETFPIRERKTKNKS